MNSRFLDDLNYAMDPRTQGPAPDTITIGYAVDEEGRPDRDGCDWVTEEVPTIWIVCPTCKGQGTHVDPAIDSGGLSAEDFQEDPDFMEDYFRGSYDVTCNTCQGRSTIKEVDRAALTPQQLEALEAQELQDRQQRAEELSEIRMGA